MTRSYARYGKRETASTTRSRNASRSMRTPTSAFGGRRVIPSSSPDRPAPRQAVPISTSTRIRRRSTTTARRAPRPPRRRGSAGRPTRSGPGGGWRRSASGRRTRARCGCQAPRAARRPAAAPAPGGSRRGPPSGSGPAVEHDRRGLGVLPDVELRRRRRVARPSEPPMSEMAPIRWCSRERARRNRATLVSGPVGTSVTGPRSCARARP